MRAQNLTISIPYKGCDKNCPYCVSKMTWSPPVNEERTILNLPKVYKMAQTAGVTSVLLTGKGEPFLNEYWIDLFTKRFGWFPVEVQTNGIYLNSRSAEDLKEMIKGLNVIAFSIDHINQLEQYSKMFEILTGLGIIVRVCINVTEMIGYDLDRIFFYINLHSKGSIRQVLFRNITMVKGTDPESSPAKWIKENTNPKAYIRMASSFERANVKHIIRTIPETGVKVFDFKSRRNGISVCFSDYCIQHSNAMDDIRSLIFHQDGHLYTSWDSPASVLF